MMRLGPIGPVAAHFCAVFYFVRNSAALVAAFAFAGGNQMFVDEGYIKLDAGIRLFYKKIGNAQNAVIIPNGLYFFDEFQRYAAAHTLIFYDLRNRGFSDPVTEPSQLIGGVEQDVEDLECVRKHFHADKVDLIGHSYIGLMVGLYAIRYQSSVNRVIQIGPAQPDAGKQYAAHLTNTDNVSAELLSRIAQMQKEKEPEDPIQRCKRFWSVFQAFYVADPKFANQFQWGRCELPNERNLMKYLNEYIFPSIQKVHLTAQQLTDVQVPFLIIHGTKDRSSPYGGGREWSLILPNARLLTIENAAHVPWIEAPEIVFPAVTDFLAGKWPEAVEKVKSLENV
jgi:proline iminopeptidase